MKVLFFSDIHGVADNLEKLLNFIEELKPDQLVLLGDALYHGPRNGVPESYDGPHTASLLNSLWDKIIAVRGNCDAEVDQMLINFPIMSDYAQLITPNKVFFLTHGHLWNENNLPNLAKGSVLAHGHTHIPVLKTLDNGITIFNPGSLSLPKGGFPKTFGFYDGEELSVRLLEDGSILELID